VRDRRALVHYLSPFAPPSWLPTWQAQLYLEADGRRWSKLEELGMVSLRQRAAGPPRIERT
jgi:hypothetical protein